MKTHVSVIPVDHLIIVDGTALHFGYPAPKNLHALQWHNGAGHMEFSDDLNQPLSGEALYQEEVAPYVALWEAEKARLDKARAEAEAQRLAEYNSEPARAARLREERDRRIAATDCLMAVDYPLSDARRAEVAAYRQALRDLPAQKDAPWDGGGDKPPWPVLPAQGKGA